MASRLVLCHGVFDLFHQGHIDHFIAARAYGDRLVVSVSPDHVIASRKPGRPICTLRERLALIRGCIYVDETWVGLSADASAAIYHWCPAYFVKGSDYTLDSLSDGEKNACAAVGAQIVFTQSEKRSSTEIIQRCK